MTFRDTKRVAHERIDTSSPMDWSARLCGQAEMVRAYAFALTGDWPLADDVAQEALVIAWNKRDTLREPRALGAWLRGIARNVARREWARTPRESTAPLDVFEPFWDEEDSRAEVWPDEYVQAVRRCRSRLSAPARQLLDGRYARDQTLAQLAVEAGRTVAAIRSALHRARVALATCVRRAVGSDAPPQPLSRPSSSSSTDRRTTGALR